MEERSLSAPASGPNSIMPALYGCTSGEACVRDLNGELCCRGDDGEFLSKSSKARRDLRVGDCKASEELSFAPTCAIAALFAARFAFTSHKRLENSSISPSKDRHSQA